ncbi:MAG: hypothetical protein K2K08_05760 [Paramuribaculum sp.]|nr:hypothetical protein [Paramuribaculum sp.]
MNISKYIWAAAALVLSMSSCSSDGYWEEYQESGTKFAFEQKTLNVATVKSTNTYTLNVVRSDSKGSVSLPISVVKVLDLTFSNRGEAVNNVTLSTNTLTFEDGQNVASVDVTINCLGGHKYQAQVGFAADDKSIAGSNTCTMTFVTEHTWVSLGKGIFFDGFVNEDIDAEVEILQAEGFQRYRVVKPYDQLVADDPWYSGETPEYFEFFEEEDEDGNTVLNWNTVMTGLNYQGVSGQPIMCVSPADEDESLKDCFWAEEGHAVLSPIYNIPKVGTFGQVKYAVQILLPSYLAED